MMSKPCDVFFMFNEPLKVRIEKESSYTEEQLVQKAEKILIDKICHTKKLPPYTYSINQDNHEVPIRLGQAIRLRKNGLYGVVVNIRKNYNYPIRVRLFKGSVIGVKEKDFEITERVNIHTLMESSLKKESITGDWEEGDLAYLITENGTILPIVFGLGSAYYYHAIPLLNNPKGTYIRLTKDDLSRVARTIDEAIKKRVQ